MKASMMGMPINPAMLGLSGMNPLGPGQMSGGMPMAIPGPNGTMMLVMPSGLNPGLNPQQGSSSTNPGQQGASGMQIPGLGGAMNIPGMPNPFLMGMNPLGQPNNPNNPSSQQNKSNQN